MPHKLASNVTSAFGQIGLGESHTETRNFVNILCINTYHLEMAFDTASNNIYLANTDTPTNTHTHIAQRAAWFIRPKEQVGPQNLQIKSGLRQLNEFTNDWTSHRYEVGSPTSLVLRVEKRMWISCRSGKRSINKAA